MPRLERGLIQIYTGNGKGKTTAALGQAIRAIGQGLKVYLVQFLKVQLTGEITVLKQLEPNFKLVRLEIEHPYFRPRDEQEIKEIRDRIEQMLRQVKETMLTKEYDLIILDEVNSLVSDGLLDIDVLLGLLKGKPEDIELILTGRQAPSQLIESADLVTEMVNRKHPFQKGIKARKGIEY